MELTVLTVPDCPHGELLEQRLEQALAGRPATIVRREIGDADQALRYGMRGSPTLLIDGVDLFAAEAGPAGLSCRLYRSPDGRVEGAPSVEQLRFALDALHEGPLAVVAANFRSVSDPIASRPYMPGYGTLPPDEGRGLLPWSWAEERLIRSHDFWLATVTPDGLPHLMPVWAVWRDGTLWFSSSNGSRKARNLGAEPRCTMSTDDPREPVVVQGQARRVTDLDALAAMLDAENVKYGTAYGMDTMDPASNSVFALTPEWVFALDSRDFNGSPTRFVFSPS